MFVQIGRRQPPEGLVTLFLECHGRIRAFTEIALRLGEQEDVPPEEVVDASARCLRYFTEALPLHIADEEESLLPLLRGREAAVDAALELMHAQHEAHEPLLAELVDALRERRGAPEATSARARLATAARRAQPELLLHLEHEERVLFPAARRLLTGAEEQAVLTELRARRHR